MFSAPKPGANCPHSSSWINVSSHRLPTGLGRFLGCPVCWGCSDGKKNSSTPPRAMESPGFRLAGTSVRFPFSSTPLLRLMGSTRHVPPSSRCKMACVRDTEGKFTRISARRARPMTFSQ